MPQAGMLLLGVIVGAKGIKGELKVKSFTETPKILLPTVPCRINRGRQLIS